MSKNSVVPDALHFGGKNITKEIKKIEKNMNDMIENYIMKDDADYCILVGRKSYHLLNGKIKALKKKYIVSNCTVMLNQELIMFEPIIKHNSEVIIFIDTIHHGNEMKAIIKKLKERKCVVKNIYCYLKNEEGVLNILKEIKINKDICFSLYDSVSEKEYSEKTHNLNLFFHSVVIPMNKNISYIEYIYDKKIYNKTIIKKFNKILGKLFQINNFFELCDSGPQIKGINIYKNTIKDDKILRDFSNKFLTDSPIDEIDGLTITIKIKKIRKKPENRLVIWAAPCFTYNIDYTKKCTKYLKSHNYTCNLKNITYKKDIEIKLRKNICNICYTTIISKKILNTIDNNIKNNLSFTKKKRYNPFDKKE